MSYSKFITIVLTSVVCASLIATDASAQRGGGGGGRGGSGGGSAGRGPSGGGGRGPSGGGGRGPATGPSGRYGGPSGGRAPYYSNRYRPYYGYGRGYRGYYGYGYPGFSIGFGLGYPYYGYGYYGYPYYGAYGYGYGGYYPGAYAAPGSAPSGYAVQPGYAAYGGIRIQGAPRDAQVFVDGHYAGAVDNYNGTFDQLGLQAGPHEIEVRMADGRPLTYDVNVTPGQTLTIHANVR